MNFHQDDPKAGSSRFEKLPLDVLAFIIRRLQQTAEPPQVCNAYLQNLRCSRTMRKACDDGMRYLDLPWSKYGESIVERLTNLEDIRVHNGVDKAAVHHEDLPEMMNLLSLSAFASSYKTIRTIHVEGCGNNIMKCPSISDLLSKLVAVCHVQIENVQQRAVNNAIITSMVLEAGQLPLLEYITVKRCADLINADLSESLRVWSVQFSGNANLQFIAFPKHACFRCLDCRDNGKLALLDVSNISSLKSLKAAFNRQLIKIDASNSLNVADIDSIANTALTTIDLHNCTELLRLKISFAPLLELILPQNGHITTLHLHGTRLPVGHNSLSSLTYLQTLMLEDTNVQRLVLRLQGLHTATITSNASLCYVDLSGCNSLECLNVMHNTELTDLKLCECPSLKQLTSKHQPRMLLLQLDGSNNFTDIELSHMYELQELNLGGQSDLTYLKLNAMNLGGDLNLSSSTQLKRVHFKHCGNLENVTIPTAHCTVIVEQCIMLRVVHSSNT